MKQFFKILALTIVALALIATCACAFNSKEVFYIVCGVITLAANGYSIVCKGKELVNKED